MKDAIKELWRQVLHFWYPAIVICWGTEDYVTGLSKGKWISMILGVGMIICGLILFYNESEKLRKEEKDEDAKSEQPTRDLTEEEADIYDKWILSESTDTGETLTTTFKQEEHNG